MRSIIDYLTEEKLSVEKRNNLSNDVFCGPNRSFPCHDCKHIIAAKAFVDRSHYSEKVKQSIRNCIERKSKELGCDNDSK